MQLFQHFVDDAVHFCLFRGHEEVAVDVFLDLFELLTRIFRENLVEARAGGEDVLRGDLDVGGHAFGAAGGLVNHYFGVRKGKALALFACREKDCTHRSRHTDAHGGDIRLDVVHGVCNRKAGGDVPTGGVDVERDVFLWIFGSQKEELGDYKVRHMVINRAAEKHDALLEKARVDVIGALAHVRLLDDHRD